jgi:NADPH-dependent glutamate synthase beta subunit-like oxidoreductase
VGVIGGGDAACDAARVALRQKAVTKVTMLYRRTREEMPALVEEAEAAVTEGIEIQTLVAPVEVIAKNGKLIGLKVVKCKLGDLDESGRRRPVPIPGSEYVIELDTLIVAISERPEREGLSGLKRHDSGTVVVNPESLLTSRPGVFAGGDVVVGPNTVVEAIAAGKRAAHMIGNYVSGKLLKSLPKPRLPSCYVEPVEGVDDESEGAGRIHEPVLPVERRNKNFKEVELCVSESDARCEALRCLRCDLDFTRPD